MNVDKILRTLPPFENKWQLIEKRQTVRDIMREIADAHNVFNKDYDRIAFEFYYNDLERTFKALWGFCKANVIYREESEKAQLSMSPAAILSIGKGDCKTYSLFIAGVLSALKRAGIKLDWWYRFATYDGGDQYGHVFVVARWHGVEYWIDPVLSAFNKRLQPTSYTDKHLNVQPMALYRVSGVSEVANQYPPDMIEILPRTEFIQAIKTLLEYRVLNNDGRVNDAMLLRLHKQLPSGEFEKVARARAAIQVAVIGGFFDTIWRGVKKVTLFVPRNAFLSLIGLNVRGYATKMYNAIFNKDGSYDLPAKEKLKKQWQDRWGGDWTALENTIKTGARKKAILGTIGVAPAVPAWIVTAGAVIAAIMPLVKAILDSKAQSQIPLPETNPYPYGLCDDGYTPKAPDGSCPAGGGEKKDLMEWVKANPAIVVAGGLGILYLLTSKK